MTALDTNVLIRYLVGDVPERANSTPLQTFDRRLARMQGAELLG